MSKLLLMFAWCLMVICWFLVGHSQAEPYGKARGEIKLHLDRLVHYYPNFVSAYDDTYLILKSGKRFRISDGRTDKTFKELLERPDIDDMFYLPYPKGAIPKPPEHNFDPGRVRFEPLFAAMYGDCERNEVVKFLRSVAWLPRHGGGNVRVTMINGVAAALEAVSNELDQLPGNMIKYVREIGGTYNCRNIAGSTSKSMHAYGAAIDINPIFGNYWQWTSNAPNGLRWQNNIPIEIIRAFEKHGFIWGGYWYHFDTMHFEYRPELLGSN